MQESIFHLWQLPQTWYPHPPPTKHHDLPNINSSVNWNLNSPRPLSFHLLGTSKNALLSEETLKQET